MASIPIVCLQFFLVFWGWKETYGEKLNLTSPEVICKSKTKGCSECIQTPGCLWCKDSGKHHLDIRCYHDIHAEHCNEVEDPISELLESKITEGDLNKSIRPSRVRVKMRVGEPHKISIPIMYQDEGDRPLDLYILMDLSCTMAVHKEKVAALAQNLTENLGNLTKLLRLGFGSFVDKPVMPFAFENDLHIKNSTVNCNGQILAYSKPHLFQNHLPFTADFMRFTKTVNDSLISTNIDAPEGALDALMQALVCREEIGWKYEDPSTRRVIVLSTDGSFHISGDGKLGGIILPNDGKCHVQEPEKYKSIDYPTVSQIRHKILENNVFVIFAVTRTHRDLYKKLSEHIGSDMSSVSEITDDDSGKGITKVIEEEYKKVVRSVSLQQVGSNPYLKLTYFTKCPGDNAYKTENGCNNLKPNDSVEYQLELTLTACPQNTTIRTTNVLIQPSAGTGHYLNITVDMLCECGCENEDISTSLTNPREISTNCSSNGFKQCGICKCLDGYGGPSCNCSLSGKESLDKEGCVHLGEICSNRGQCVCGECKCDKGFVGQHCECQEDNCPFVEDEDKGICNVDAGHGKCGCKICECEPGFIGDRCQCPISTEGCIRLGKLCNNAGQCQCGKCQCDSEAHGEFCQFRLEFEPHSASCDFQLQEELRSCAKCLTFLNRYSSEANRIEGCKSECSGNVVTFIPDKEVESRQGLECEGKVMEDDTLCEIRYFVKGENIETNEIHFRIEFHPICPPPSPIVPAIISVAGVILVIGILTLLVWKLLTHIHDKKEYQRFEEERAKAQWSTNQNPLYTATVTEYRNPAYSMEDLEDDGNSNTVDL